MSISYVCVSIHGIILRSTLSRRSPKQRVGPATSEPSGADISVNAWRTPAGNRRSGGSQASPRVDNSSISGTARGQQGGHFPIKPVSVQNGIVMPRLIPTLMLAALVVNISARAQHMNEKDSPCVNTVVTVDLANCLAKSQGCGGRSVECRVRQASREARRRREAAPCGASTPLDPVSGFQLYG